MLSSKGYQRTHSNAAYRKAADHIDLLTAFANDVERAQQQYEQFNLAKRDRVFDEKDINKVKGHAGATAFERQLDTAKEQLCIFLPDPNEALQIERVYKSNKRQWNDTAANRFEIKIINSKKIIAKLQENYGMHLRKNFHYEDSRIYFGDGKYAQLAPGSSYDILAKILFQDIHKVWQPKDIHYEITRIRDISDDTAEADRIYDLHLKRLAQTINTKISEVAHEPTKLVIYANHTIKLDVFQFDIFERLTNFSEG